MPTRKEQLEDTEVGTNLRIEDAGEEEEEGKDDDKTDTADGENLDEDKEEKESGGEESEKEDKEKKDQIEGAKEGTPKWLQDKIDKSTYQKHEAERRADKAEQELATIKASEKQKDTESDKPKKPDIADYEDTGKFMEDWEKYQDDKVEQKLTKFATEQDTKLKSEVKAQSAGEIRSNEEDDFAEKGTAKYGDDFVAKVDNAELYHPVIMDDIVYTKNIDLANYLSTHVDEAQRIAKLDNISAVREYVKIEKTLSGESEQKDETKKEKKKVLPNPIDAAKQNATIVTDNDGNETTEQIEKRKYGDRVNFSGSKMVQM